MKRIGYITVLLALILTVDMISPAAVTHASTEGAANDPAVGWTTGADNVTGLEYSEPDTELPGGLNALEGTLITDGINSSLSGTEKPGTGSIVSVKSGSSGYSLKELGGNEYGYESLTDAEKMIFDAIGNELEDFIASDRYKSDLNESNSKIEIYCEISSGDEITAEDIAKVICRFVYSNPSYYWIGQQYWFGLEGDQASAAICVDPYYYDYFSRKATDDVISRQTEIWVDEIRAASNSAGDYYGALKAHDLIIRAADYAYNSKGNAETAVWAHSIAGIFTGSGAVCEGYAKCFEYLMNLADIPNIYVLGDGAREDHAWNAVQLNGEWFLCDVTWDDPNEKTNEGLNDSNYTYFFMPESLFAEKHTPWNSGKHYCFSLPEFSDSAEYTYFNMFGCISEEGFDEAGGEEFAARIIDNRYPDNDYVFAVFPKNAENSFLSCVAPHLPGFDPEGNYYLSDSPYGSILKYEYPVILNPADSISLPDQSVLIEIAESKTISAILPAGSDDKVIWSVAMPDKEAASGDTGISDAYRFVNLSAKGREVVITGRRNGTVVLVATVYSSKGTDTVISASCTVTVGNGIDSADYIIWQNGVKDAQKATIKTGITATGWKDDKGKSKTGKLVWIISDEPLTPSFDTRKHTLTTKVKSKLASISNKGIVTAKKAGTVYVYACDTGSFDYAEYIVEIAAAPSKLFLTSKPNTTAKDYLCRKVELDAGMSGKVYITPFIKDGVVDMDCTYTVKVSKKEQEKYASVDPVTVDDDGNAFFTIKAFDFDQIKAKTVSVKIEVICDQSGKKASMTVVIGNPVFTAHVVYEGTGEPVLANKNDTVTLKLALETMLGTTGVTTDKIKIYVGQSDVSFNDRDRVEADKGATVKAKFDRNTMKITLTASKKAGTTALITAAFTNSVTKEITLIDLADVDANGVLTLW